MNQEEYRSLIFAGREDRSREYKRSFPWERATHGETLAKVVKSILAISNLRDGGHIVIGVNEDANSNGRYIPVGVKTEHVATFSHDKVADFVREYAEPYSRFFLEIVPLDGMDFVVIAIDSFDESPVICRRSYGDVLSEGTVYVRSRSGRPRSEPVTHYSDARDLLDLAVERGIRWFLERQARVSVSMVDDRKQFERQLEDFQ